MAQYKLEVTTGSMVFAGTFDHIYVTLIGTGGTSERTELDNFGIDFKTGMTSDIMYLNPFFQTGMYTIESRSSLGKILLIKVEKDPYFLLPEDQWYCCKIVVTTPEGDVILFPCYRWISRNESVELRGGKAIKVFEEDHPLLIKHREKELKLKKNLYQWEISDERLPHHSSFKESSEIPADISLSMSKSMEILYSKGTIGAEFMLKGLAGSTKQWENIEDIRKVFRYKKTPLSEYVTIHWKEDDFYGYQYLNGVNPTVIKKCSELPSNFAVTEEMVKPFLGKESSLQKEMEKGNIFICDFKRLNGLPTRLFDGKPLHIAPGFCLLYLNQEGKLMPIAIQLQQQPSEENPIFLPSDPETDWLLAKMFIKNADFMQHQTVFHFMSTHNMSEVFTMATVRNFPVIHPLYKLLIPHGRYTLQMNSVARKNIFGHDGILSQTSIGYDGIRELMRRALAEMTYSTLCLPDNIKERGLESIPNYYYRDDGLRVWNIINSFVKGMVEYYYPSDSDVQKDSELQEWIKEIFTHAFLGKKSGGFPEYFNTVEELVKFLTMMIYTVTAQHAAVNDGQFDYHGWAPNGTLMLRKPPPTTKGQSTMETILETLPNAGDTASFAAMGWVLSDKYTDRIPLGHYTEERFDEPAPKQMIKEFQAELSRLSEAIAARNSQMEIPYTYLNPALIENSITI